MFTTTTEYAIRGIAELASRVEPGQPLLLDELVKGTDLPRDFLAKVFQRLVKAGLLRSAKGRGGGFSLPKPPHEITLLHIVNAIDGPGRLDRCVLGLSRCNDEMPCAQHDLYRPLRQRLHAYLESTTVADLAALLRSKQAWQRLRGLDLPNTNPNAGTTGQEERT